MKTAPTPPGAGICTSAATPFVRQAGAGPTVVCLHANASSSAQWRGLMDRLSASHQVLAPDSYGAGKSPDWHSAQHISLDDEVALIEPLLLRPGPPVALVGHSYGAAVALMAALRHPGRVRALVLYEPTLFALVDAEQPAPNGADGIRATLVACTAALQAGRLDRAAECFIDFWMGAGSWAAMPPARQAVIAESMVNLRRWGHALFTEPTALQAFERLQMPVLYMVGGRSPESAHAVARLLVPVLPRVQLAAFDGLGHMAPVTHPDSVNPAITAFLLDT